MAKVEDVKKNVASSKITTVYDFMEQKKDLISKALPPHIGVERVVSMFTIVVRTNPEIANCSQASLIGALVQTAQLGLFPGNVNHCYYVPFRNKKKDGSFVKEVQFILGYKGMVELVNRSRNACILSTEIVYENDEFNYALGLNPVLHHVPVWDDRGPVRGVYCVAKNLLADEKLFIYLPKEDIDKVRNASKAGSSEYSPWAKWYEEMAKKTAIKRICKLLPLAIDDQKNISTDETVKTTIAPNMADQKDETTYEDIDVTPAGEQPVEEKEADAQAQTEWEKEEKEKKRQESVRKAEAE